MKSLVIANRKVRIKRQRVHIRYVYGQMIFSPLNLSSKSGVPRQNCKSFVFTFFSNIHVCTVTRKKLHFLGRGESLKFKITAMMAAVLT